MSSSTCQHKYQHIENTYWHTPTFGVKLVDEQPKQPSLFPWFIKITVTALQSSEIAKVCSALKKLLAEPR